MKDGLATTVIIEWSNALLAEADRPRRMMEVLQEQASEWLANGPGDGAPFEVLICFDGDRVTAATIAEIAPLATPGRHGAIEVRLCDFPGAEYYELKNLGSRQAGGDLLLFLDSDVVPCNGWLNAILSAFEDPQRQIVGGTSFIEADGLYGKAMAVNWIFEMEPADTEIQPREHFWANNVCFRRPLFERRPFPVIQGASRGACARLAAELGRDGISIWIHKGARVHHPAPAGLAGFLERAMAQGRDRVLWHRQFRNTWLQSVPAGLLRYGKHLLMVTKSTLSGFRRAGIKLWEVPLVMLIAVCYYSVFLVGELATHIVPGRMKRSFRI